MTITSIPERGTAYVLSTDNTGSAIAEALRRRPGVLAADYDAASSELRLHYDAGLVSLADLEGLVRSAGGNMRITQSHPQAALSAEERQLAQLPLMIRLTIACLAALVVGWLVESLGTLPALALALYLAAYLTGGYFSIQEAWQALKSRQFDVNFLMIAAAIGAAIVGQPREGAVLMFLFSLAETLETYAMGRTHQSVRALLDMTPETAAVERNRQVVVVPVEELAVGDVIVVKPGEQIAADGTILGGESAINEAHITGESVPVDKGAGDKVFAGTLNGQGALRIRVSTPATDSTLARITRFVQEARAHKARSQDFTDRMIGQYYAYAVVGMTSLAILIPLLLLHWDIQTTLYRAMTLMVVASPCALVISIPASVLSALANSARHGVLFKGGAHLESGARVQVIAFDKTGTLTSGAPRVARVVSFGNQDPTELLRAAAAVEHFSEHPLAAAIVQQARERGLALPATSDFMALTGVGAQALVDGVLTEVIRPDRCSLGEGQAAVADLEAEGYTVVVVRQAGVLVGTLALSDTVRPQAAGTVVALQRQGLTVALLTGDNTRVAYELARQLGIAEVYAGLLPEDKVAALDQLRLRYGPVAMVGDGVNDAPALAAADLSMAMSAAGSDVAIESADVLLMSDDLARVAPALALAQRARRIIRQNLIFAFAVMLIAVGLALNGTIPLSLGVVMHEGSTLLVVANGLRLLVQRW